MTQAHKTPGNLVRIKDLCFEKSNWRLPCFETYRGHIFEVISIEKGKHISLKCTTGLLNPDGGHSLSAYTMTKLFRLKKSNQAEIMATTFLPHSDSCALSSETCKVCGALPGQSCGLKKMAMSQSANPVLTPNKLQPTTRKK